MAIATSATQLYRLHYKRPNFPTTFLKISTIYWQNLFQTSDLYDYMRTRRPITALPRVCAASLTRCLMCAFVIYDTELRSYSRVTGQLDCILDLYFKFKLYCICNKVENFSFCYVFVILMSFTPIVWILCTGCAIIFSWTMDESFFYFVVAQEVVKIFSNVFVCNNFIVFDIV